MATETLKKFAEELKSVRESKNITLQQIAAKTRIDIKYLHAIEEADFDIMPDVYMRAFIKEYASFLNLDPIVVTQQYDNVRFNKHVEKPIVEDNVEPKEVVNTEPITAAKVLVPFEESQHVSNQSTDKKKITNAQLNFIAGGLVVLVALLIIYFAFIRNSSTEIITEQTEQTQAANNQRFEVEKKNTDQDSLIAQPASDSLRLAVTTSDRVWVKVSTDGKIVQQGMVPSDTKLKYASKSNFSVTVGNAGVVKIFYNNKPIENVGRTGEIRNIFMSPDTIRYYTIPPKPKNENKSPKTN